MDSARPEEIARALWAAAPGLHERPLPYKPVLVVLVGVPLSGKSTVARALLAEARTRTLHVENDAIRAEVAYRLNTPGPVHSRRENRLTYLTAWALVRTGIAHGVNVVHDATNLNEGARREAYKAEGASVVVVFVLTPPEVVAARAGTATPYRREAHRRLGRKRPNPAAVTKPAIVLKGPEDVARLRADPYLAPLFEPPAP